MSDQANPDESKDSGAKPGRGNWTIKNFSDETRELVMKAVRQDGGTVQEWLDRACRRALAIGGPEIILPGQPVGRPGPTGPTSPSVDMAGLADLLRAAAEAAQAGLKGAAKEAAGLVRDQTRIARGLPALTGPTKGKPIPELGQPSKKAIPSGPTEGQPAP